jgi:uncharacterized protein DUF6335
MPQIKTPPAGHPIRSPYLPTRLTEQILQDLDESIAMPAHGHRLRRELWEYHSQSPRLSGHEIDAARERADADKDTVGGSAPTPDRGIVDEPPSFDRQLLERDWHRWKFNPVAEQGDPGDDEDEDWDEGDDKDDFLDDEDEDWE